MKLLKLKTAVAVGVSALVLAACGGGGGGGTPAATTTSFNGSGVKGPIFGAAVAVFQAGANGAAITGASCTNTLADGSYTCTIPRAAVGPFRVQLTGGQFCSNESQVTNGACPTGATLKTVDTPLSTIAVAPAGSTTFESAPITPFTTVAVQRSQANPSTFLSAYQTLANTYGISTNPTDNPLAGTRQRGLLNDIGASTQPLTQVVTNINDNERPTNASGDNTSQPATASGQEDQATSENLSVPTSGGGNTSGGTSGGTGGTTGGSTGGTTS